MRKNNRMTRILSAVLCAVILLTTLPAAFAADETVQYGRLNLDKVRFRKTASSSGDWWCYLDSGWMVEISGETGSYYKVRCNIPSNIDRNYIGYLMKDYVDLLDANEQTLFLQNPLQPTGDKAYVTQGATVITPDGTQSTVKPADPTQAPAAPTQAPSATSAPDAAGSFGYVTDDNVFFRQAPGSDVYWAQLPYGWLMEVVSVREPDSENVIWYEVKGGTPENVNGTYKGYIHGDYFKMLSDGENPPANNNNTGTSATVQPTQAPAADSAVYGYVNTDKVFFRSQANTSCMYWCMLNKGWEMEVVEEIRDKNGDLTWYKVRGGIPSDPNHVYNGYIMNDYFTVKGVSAPTTAPTQAPSGETMSAYGLITVSGTNVREQANDTSTALTALSTGTLVSWQGESGNYVKITSGSVTGYVKKANVRQLTQQEYQQLSGATQLPTLKPTTAPTQAPNVQPDGSLGYIKLIKGGVNVRKSPNGSTLTPTSDLQLPKGTVLAYYAQPVKAGSYDWIKVFNNGGYGYIRSDCYEILSQNAPEQPEQTPGTQPSQPAAGYIRLIKGGVNLRSAANSSSRIYGREDLDAVLPYFGKTTNETSGVSYYYVFSDKHQQFGYLSGDYAVLCNADGSDITVTPDGGENVVTGYAITTSNKVYVRKSTSTSSATVGQVKTKGTVLDMWAAPLRVGQVDWIPVTLDGQRGYIHGNYAYQLGQWQLDQFNQTGVMPTPTASPSPVPTGDSDYIIITKDNVWVRSGAGTSYAPIGNKTQVDEGEVFKYTKIVSANGSTWYRILYNSSTIAYIHGNYARVMTKLEYLEWKEQQPAAPEATPDIEINPPAQYDTLRLGSSGEKVLELQKALHKLGYLAESAINGEYLTSTVDAVKAFQKANSITVDGIAGKTTQSEIYRLATAGNNAGSSINGVTLYPVEKSDWFTGDIQKVWAKGETAIVTDVYTGISFVARRWSGYYHADVEPLTAKDSAAMSRIYGTSNTQEIEDRMHELQTWRRRPLWVTIDNRTFAASMYGVPHNYPDGDTIKDNNYSGQFCIHFVNSMTHGGQQVDKDNSNNGYFGHQSAIEYAYKKSISGTK